MKELIKKYLPENFLYFYHTIESFLAAAWYGFPGRQLIIIGITGTKGKTTTANFVWSILKAHGLRVGIVSTANIRMGDKEWLNPYRMTFPPAFQMQKLLRQMLDAGCTHAIMEATSAALAQNRHIGITFTAGIFTNLSPEHLELHHGSFEEYRQMKERLFQALEENPNSISIVNADSEQAPYFTAYTAGKNFTYGIAHGMIQATRIEENESGVDFSIREERYHLNTIGGFNVYNALPGIVLAHAWGISADTIRAGLVALSGIPGRMEKITAGQPFMVIVDYAHEGLSVGTVLDVAKRMKKEGSRILVVTGATGGGRDKAKRNAIGTGVGLGADLAYITDEDPYNDDPEIIIKDVAEAVRATGKKDGVDLFVISNRKEAIHAALTEAKENDIVLIIGKGAEQTMQVKGGAIAWDDRAIARAFLKSKYVRH
jgi:UDP-N-acetylmuramoyl-L-alanyl-D-glutamate--2,6-diaminopimelate ligase